MFGRTTRIFGSGQEALPEVREWFEGPPGFPEVVERPSQMSESGQESLPDVQECSGGLP